MRQRGSADHSVRAFLTIGTLYSYLYCMLSSNVLFSLPILGGAMYLAGQTALMLGTVRRPAQDKLMSPASHKVFTALLILLLILLLLLFAIYPVALESADFWRLAGIVFCITMRPILTRYLVERAFINHRKTGNILLRILAVQLLFLPPLLLMLLLSPLSRGTVWALIGGYLVSGVLESFPLDRMRERMRSFSPEDRAEVEALRGVHAYKMYEALMLFIAAALQVTQVMSFTYIAVTAGALILCMGIALLCTYAASLSVEAVLRRKAAQHSDPNFLLMVGLALWMYGLVLFTSSLETPGSVTSYVSLALCTAGSTICVRVLIRLEEDMRRVAAFAIGHQPSDAIDMVQQTRISLSTLGGQMVALVGLILICVFTSTDFPNNWETVFRSFSPLLTLPAVILVGAAILFAIKFPLTRQHMDKLRRYMEIQESGSENAPLHDQLERVVIQKSLKRYGIKAIIWILRPICFHKIKGREKVRLDADTPCVFVCNHGEIYGPVVATLYVPFSFRPWVAYEMTDKNAILERTMNGAFQNVKFGRKLLYAVMARFGAPFLAWIMESVDCIPVYHDNPRKLIQTFRETVTAMQAGDNILLFPENADTSADHRYVREGVSEFFTGFTMIGQMYNSKTGKCPLFIPLYADKRKRTITFGVPTRYDPDANPNEEKERLCHYLRGEMLRIAGMDRNA